MSNKKNKLKHIETEEQIEVRNFIKMLLIVIILVLIVYVFTRIFVSKDLFNKKNEETKIEETVEGKIDYTTLLIGTMLNKGDEQYYVLIYDTSSVDAGYFSNILTNYKNKLNSILIYSVDLASPLNKSFIAENSNLMVDEIEDFRVKDVALIKVKDKKIVEAIDEETKIAETLK